MKVAESLFPVTLIRGCHEGNCILLKPAGTPHGPLLSLERSEACEEWPASVLQAFISSYWFLASPFASSFPAAAAWAFAERTSARNGSASFGAATFPESKALVVTLSQGTGRK